MQRSALGLRLPEGMHDMLPEELVLQEQLEENILKLFKSWSYQKVVTPTLEYRACVEPDADKEDQLYKFFDRQGYALALRPEFTTPIARFVSTRLRGAELPLRLCYAADVYRNSSLRYREFRQVGVELIGSGSELADAEVIALAVEGMRSLGLEDFQFNLGHMGIFKGLIRATGLDEEVQGRLEDALARKDIVGVEGLVSQSGLAEDSRELLVRLPHLHGQEEVLNEVLSWSRSAEMREAVEGLRRIYRYLADFGVQEYVAIDLGILRRFSYYTGVIFEGYVPGIGIPVVEGGRYDALYEDFGYPLPATGFALHLGSIRGQFPLPSPPAADVLIYGSDPDKIIASCRVLRAQGERVEMAVTALTPAEAQELAEKKNIGRVYRIE